MRSSRVSSVLWTVATFLIASTAFAQGAPGAQQGEAKPDDAQPAAPGGGAPEGSEDIPSAPHPKAAIDPVAPGAAGAPGAGGPEAPAFSFSHPYVWPQGIERINVSGYVLPQFELVSLPTALPRDQLQYGARGSRAGFALYGTPFEGWSYMVHVVILPAGTETLAILSPTATVVSATTLTVSTATGTSLDVEEASLAYRPAKWYLARTGVLRIPFSVSQVTPVPKQMFPIRAAETEAFQSGADVGFLNTLLPFDARLQVNLGVFMGSSLVGLTNPNETVRGVALAGSVEAHPLGAMSLREGDQSRGPFRFAFGIAGIYRSATAYDATGYEATHFTDERLDAAVRASFKGLYLQGEYLRHLQTDDISGRPSLDVGAYAQGSFYQPIGHVAFQPLVRVGTLTTNEDFAPRKFTSFEGGIAFYPRADLAEPEKLRIIAEYFGATVSPLTESEHEGLLQLQLEW